MKRPISILLGAAMAAAGAVAGSAAPPPKRATAAPECQMSVAPGSGRSLYLALRSQIDGVVGACAEIDLLPEDARFLADERLDGEHFLGLVVNRPYDSNFSVTVFRRSAVRPSGEPARVIRGRMFRTQDVVLATRKLSIGERIGPGDVRVARVRVDRVPGQASASLEELHGMQVKWPVQPNTVILNSQLQSPSMVEKGAPVTVLYEASNLSVTMPAQALENGARGQVIEVRNEVTNRRLRARVRDQSTVTLN